MTTIENSGTGGNFGGYIEKRKPSICNRPVSGERHSNAMPNKKKEIFAYCQSMLAWLKQFRQPEQGRHEKNAELRSFH